MSVESASATFEGNEQEISSELFAVVEAVCLKPVRLTKSGIPPKPLWNAINQRLVWQDPAALLYDWEEIDQVRFIYRLAEALDLFRPDADGWLRVAPGADQYFFAPLLGRARMLRHAYLRVFDWDERCDARDDEGHRFNFGRAHRRDFVHDPMDLRLATLGLLEELGDDWVPTAQLATALSTRVPDLLSSEACEPVATDATGLDPEKLRFVNYWFTLVARFGWADMGRLSHAAPTARLTRASALGRALVHGGGVAEADGPPIEIGARLEVRLHEDARASDRYAVHRLTASEGSDLRLGLAGIRRAAHDGADVRACLDHIRARAIGERDALDELIAQALPTRPVARIVHNASLVELDPADVSAADAAKQAEVARNATGALAAGLRAITFYAALGGEPEEGFTYPSEEPLAVLEAGPTLALPYEELPLQHRDLLVLLGAERDCGPLPLDGPALERAKGAGWTLKSFCAALAELTQKSVPPAIRAAFAETLP